MKIKAKLLPKRRSGFAHASSTNPPSHSSRVMPKVSNNQRDIIDSQSKKRSSLYQLLPDNGVTSAVRHTPAVIGRTSVTSTLQRTPKSSN
jgi:hypothetical protein